MRVRITEIEGNQSVVPGTTRTGFRGKFQCELDGKPFEGVAIFVPVPGFEHNLDVGNEIYVETSQESISDLAILSKPASPVITPLKEPGNYFIRAQVDSVHDYGVTIVKVGDCSFVIDVLDEHLEKMDPGAWVQFNLHGLGLYDTNI